MSALQIVKLWLLIKQTQSELHVVVQKNYRLFAMLEMHFDLEIDTSVHI